MNITGVNGSSDSSVQSTGVQTTDSVSRNIQNQIWKLQQQMQELSSNDALSMEEKMKKRQELQKQIFELQNQLRQHEIELRREEQQAKGSDMDEMLADREVTETAESAGVSKNSMENIISADSAMSLAKTQGNVATELKGNARVLEGEIKMDLAHGRDVEAKQEELAEIEQRAGKVVTSQMNILGNAAEKIERASAEDSVMEQENSEADKENSLEILEDTGKAMFEKKVESVAEHYQPIDILL